MKTDLQNYDSRINKFDIENLPEKYQKGHAFLLKSRHLYDRSETIAKAIDLYFKTLDELIEQSEENDSHENSMNKQQSEDDIRREYSKVNKVNGKIKVITIVDAENAIRENRLINQKGKKVNSSERDRRDDNEELIAKYNKQERFVAAALLSQKSKPKSKAHLKAKAHKGRIMDKLRKNPASKAARDKRKISKANPVSKNEPAAKKPTKTKVTKEKTVKVKKEKVVKAKVVKAAKLVKPKTAIYLSEDVKFLHKYLLLHGKTKTKDQVRSFVTSLQKAILDKKIRKTSIYAKAIENMQIQLVSIYEDMKQTYKFILTEQCIQELKQITEGEKIIDPIDLIRSFLAIEGKENVKERAKKLFEKIKAATIGGGFSETDEYYRELFSIGSILKSYIDYDKPMMLLKSKLHGLQGIVDYQKKKNHR